MTKEQITQTLNKHRSYLQAEFGVSRIALFGSRARGTEAAGSDIDLLLEFSRPIGFRFMLLAEYLESILGTEVDILTPEGLAGIRVPQVAAEIQDSLIYV